MTELDLSGEVGIPMKKYLTALPTEEEDNTIGMSTLNASKSN